MHLRGRHLSSALHGRDVGTVLQRLGKVTNVADDVSVALEGQGYDGLELVG